jgi:hypothetical protein
MSDAPALDLLVVSRYALLAALTRLIPIPILDALVETWIRRRLTRLQLYAFGLALERRDVAMLGDGDAGGCVGMVFSVVAWPFRKLLFYLLWVLMVKAVIDTFSAVVARSVLLHEALIVGALPGDSVAIRAAMQRAKKGVDTRPLDRAVGIVFRTTRGELWRLWRDARGRVRTEAGRERRDEDRQADEADPLEDKLERLALALASAVWLPELHDELRVRLRRELGVEAAAADPAPGSEPDPG